MTPHFNPWVGCSKVSPGCAHCYAETLVTGRMGRSGTWGENGKRERTSPGLWAKPLRWAKLARAGLLPDGTENPDFHRPRVFCASLADVFEPRAEVAPWRHDLFELIEATPELDWLVLTKRPDVALEWLSDYYYNLEIRNWVSRDGLGWGCPPNLWIGTSIENSRFTWRADVLRRIPAAVRFISAEPLLGSLFLGPTSGESPDVADGLRQPDPGSIPGGSTLEDRAQPATPGGVPGGSAAQSGGHDELDPVAPAARRAPLDLTGIDWVIVGGESGGRSARPLHPTWAREIRHAVLFNGGPDRRDRPERPAFHFKQWGSWTPDPDGRDPLGEWVDPDGRSRTMFAADAYDDLPDGSMRMRYAGAAPKSGGKFLDAVDWDEFPQYDPSPATTGGTMTETAEEIEEAEVAEAEADTEAEEVEGEIVQAEAAEVALARLPDFGQIEIAFGLPEGSADQNGLALSDARMTFDEWAQMGHGLSRFNRWSRFALGDWLNWGAEVFGEDHAQAVEATASERYDVANRITGLKVETLRNYASVCGRVPLAVRRVELGFSDHEPVAALDVEEQAIWLARAVENGWDRAELREEIKAAKRGGNASENGDAPVVEVEDPPLSRGERAFEVLQLVVSQGQPTSDGSLLIPPEVSAQAHAVVGEE